MEAENRLINGSFKDEDIEIEMSLRPPNLDEFVGQEQLRQNLTVYIQAAKKRGEPLDHCLFFGPPGLGKTTLANIIAEEMGASLKPSSGPVLERPGDLAGVLTNLQEGDILFIDEIHRLPHIVEEYLYPAMEDYFIEIMIDKGASARTVRINLPRFTLVGATTRSGLLTSPLRARFGIVERMQFYSDEQLAKIVERSAGILKIDILPEGALEIARRSRGTPRIANRILRRVRDFAEVQGDGRVDLAIAAHALKMLDVDSEGLDQMDKKIISVMMHNFSGGPVGLGTISVAIGEEAETIEEIYEPYLIQRGFLKRTPQGRLLTPHAYTHMGVEVPQKIQKELWSS